MYHRFESKRQSKEGFLQTQNVLISDSEEESLERKFRQFRWRNRQFWCFFNHRIQMPLPIALYIPESYSINWINFRQASARRRKSEGVSVNTSTFYTTVSILLFFEPEISLLPWEIAMNYPFQLSIEASRTALKIDKACRYLFPGGFLAFNLIYWW